MHEGDKTSCSPKKLRPTLDIGSHINAGSQRRERWRASALMPGWAASPAMPSGPVSTASTSWRLPSQASVAPPPVTCAMPPWLALPRVSSAVSPGGATQQLGARVRMGAVKGLHERLQALVLPHARRGVAEALWVGTSRRPRRGRWWAPTQVIPSAAGSRSALAAGAQHVINRRSAGRDGHVDHST
jgi:hypothetical protein